MQTDPYEDPKALGHEPIGTNVRAVWLTGAGLAAIVLGSFLLVAGMMRYFASEDFALREPPGIQPPMTPGIPQLDPSQPIELKHLRERERNELSSYGWIEREAGIAHIPIDRAMQIVAAEGLPQFTSPTSQGNNAEETSTERSEPR